MFIVNVAIHLLLLGFGHAIVVHAVCTLHRYPKCKPAQICHMVVHSMRTNVTNINMHKFGIKVVHSVCTQNIPWKCEPAQV